MLLHISEKNWLWSPDQSQGSLYHREDHGKTLVKIRSIHEKMDYLHTNFNFNFYSFLKSFSVPCWADSIKKNYKKTADWLHMLQKTKPPTCLRTQSQSFSDAQTITVHTTRREYPSYFSLPLLIYTQEAFWHHPGGSGWRRDTSKPYSPEEAFQLHRGL